MAWKSQLFPRAARLWLASTFFFSFRLVCLYLEKTAEKNPAFLNRWLPEMCMSQCPDDLIT